MVRVCAFRSETLMSFRRFCAIWTMRGGFRGRRGRTMVFHELPVAGNEDVHVLSDLS